jgi:hypothetical protein
MRYSYLSLIEKGYAKVHGNYENLYRINNSLKYVFELTNSIPCEDLLSKNMPEKGKEEIWNYLKQLKK